MGEHRFRCLLHLFFANMADQIIINPSDVVKEGFLVKESMHLKQWQRRYFVLTSQYLCSFKQQNMYSNPTEVIRLREGSTVKSSSEETGREHTFRVESPNRTFELIAENAQDKEAWIGIIGRQMVRPTVMVDEEWS